MRIAIPVLLLLTSTVSHCSGQPALNKLEDQLQANQPRPVAKVHDDQVGYLGIVADDRTDGGKGIRIRDIVSGGPAGQAELRTGDLIMLLDGNAVASMQEFATVMTAARPDQTVVYTVRRGEKSYEIRVKLGKRPPPAERPFPLYGSDTQPLHNGENDSSSMLVEGRKRLLGVRSVPVTDYARRFFQIPSDHGALVSEVVAGSPAEQAGVPVDAVIVAVNEQPVSDPNALAQLVEAAGDGAKIELSYYSRGTLSKQEVILRNYSGQPNADSARVKEVKPDALPPDVRDSETIDLNDLNDRMSRLERRLQRLETLIQRMLPSSGSFPAVPPGET